MKNVNQLISKACRAGFDSYGNFNEGDYQHEVMTCTRGDFSGEVIDIYYDFYSGEVHKVEISSQFPPNHPHYSTPKFQIIS